MLSAFTVVKAKPTNNRQKENEFMSILSIFKHRRSVRQYTGEAIPQEILEQVLKAGLTSASGRARRPWEFVIVRNK